MKHVTEHFMTGVFRDWPPEARARLAAEFTRHSGDRMTAAVLPSPLATHVPTPAAAAVIQRYPQPRYASDVTDWASYQARQRALSVDLIIAHLPGMDAPTAARARATLALLAEQLADDAAHVQKRLDIEWQRIDLAPPAQRVHVSQAARPIEILLEEIQTARLHAELARSGSDA